MTVTLVLGRRVTSAQVGRLNIISSRPLGLTDAKGHPMTNEKGRPIDYVRNFVWGTTFQSQSLKSQATVISQKASPGHLR